MSTRSTHTGQSWNVGCTTAASKRIEVSYCVVLNRTINSISNKSWCLQNDYHNNIIMLYTSQLDMYSVDYQSLSYD